jgi:hypothetical protein
MTVETPHPALEIPTFPLIRTNRELCRTHFKSVIEIRIFLETIEEDDLIVFYGGVGHGKTTLGVLYVEYLLNKYESRAIKFVVVVVGDKEGVIPHKDPYIFHVDSVAEIPKKIPQYLFEDEKIHWIFLIDESKSTLNKQNQKSIDYQGLRDIRSQRRHIKAKLLILSQQYRDFASELEEETQISVECIRPRNVDDYRLYFVRKLRLSKRSFRVFGTSLLYDDSRDATLSLKKVFEMSSVLRDTLGNSHRDQVRAQKLAAFRKECILRGDELDVKRKDIAHILGVDSSYVSKILNA